MNRAIARALVTDEAKMALVARFVTIQARKEVRNAAQQSMIITTPSPPSSRDGPSSSVGD